MRHVDVLLLDGYIVTYVANYDGASRDVINIKEGVRSVELTIEMFSQFRFRGEEHKLSGLFSIIVSLSTFCRD